MLLQIFIYRKTEKRKFFDLFVATIKHLLSDRRQVLLILITAYSGFEQAFMTGDYTRVNQNILDTILRNKVLLPQNFFNKLTSAFQQKQIKKLTQKSLD